MVAPLRLAARFVLRKASVRSSTSPSRQLQSHPAIPSATTVPCAASRSRWGAARDASGVSCVQLPDIFALSSSPPMGTMSLLDALKPRAIGAVRGMRLAPVGDALVMLRGAVRAPNLQRIRIVRTVPVRFVRAAVGMAWAAAVASEPRHSLSPPLSTSLRSNQGPRRIGIGCLSPFWRKMLAAALALFFGGGALYVGISCAQGVMAVVLCSLLCFATRPDLKSFVTWVKERSPAVAKRKQLLVDRVRVLAAPYLLRLRPPVLHDYGLFSVVLLTDHEQYVYVYAGCMSRWCLLGWYNSADEYDFDSSLTKSL